MLLHTRCVAFGAALLAAGLITGVSIARAEGPAGAEPPDATQVTRYRPEAPSTDIVAEHPLKPVIDYARREQRYLQQTLQDFTCRLVKRERIGGYLQDLHFVDMEVREGAYRDGRIISPLSIYLRFLGPQTVVGRKVLYIEGQNDGQMLVRNGGKHFDYVIVNLDPNGDTAREESLVPITEIGFNRLLDNMIDVLMRHQRIDASGENSRAERIAGAKINDRACTVIRITHPQPMQGLEFHQANVFVDDALHVPVRVDYSDWPPSPGRPAPLIAEYTYTNMKLNVGLPDATFNRTRLRSQSDGR